MYIQSLELKNYRNYEYLNIDFDSGTTILYGNNAQGKTNIIVTDGKRDFQCQLELISDEGLARVKFINKGKTYITKNNHLRMVDAIRELTEKLNDYGLSLKICQCCKYFQPLIDGSTNMVKGCCKCQFQGRVEGDIIPTLVWNTCPKFEEQNIVNLF